MPQGKGLCPSPVTPLLTATEKTPQAPFLTRDDTTPMTPPIKPKIIIGSSRREPLSVDSQPRAAQQEARSNGGITDPAAPKVREIKICGRNAAASLFERRPDDIIRVYVTEESLRIFPKLLKWCATNKRAYHVVTPEDLEKVADTVHHEGICVLARQKAPLEFLEFLKSLRDDTPESPRCVVFLENVLNPHNIGAIMRVCAHFGAATLLVSHSEKNQAVGLSTSVYRTAEGGAESVELVPVEDPIRALRALKKAGFTLIATSGRASRSLYRKKMPVRCVFMFGSEGEGLSNDLLETADVAVAIPGTGNVESLNVACAASVLLGEYWRETKKVITTHHNPSKDADRAFKPTRSTSGGSAVAPGVAKNERTAKKENAAPTQAPQTKERIQARAAKPEGTSRKFQRKTRG